MKTIIFSIAALFLLSGCHKPEVNYDEIFTAPKLEIKNNEIIATGGSSKIASASYVIPHVKIEENKIYVFGTLSLRNNIQVRIKMHRDKKYQKWEAYWINRDGTLVKLEIEN